MIYWGIYEFFFFLFNLMIFYLTWLKNGAFEKNQIYLTQPGSKISHTTEFHRLFSPNLLIFLLKKLAPSPLKNEGCKGEEGGDQKQWSILLYWEIFCTLHLPAVHYLSRTERKPPWFSLLKAPFTNLASKILASKFG